jgi:hypothetical protein
LTGGFIFTATQNDDIIFEANLKETCAGLARYACEWIETGHGVWFISSVEGIAVLWLWSWTALRQRLRDARTRGKDSLDATRYKGWWRRTGCEWRAENESMERLPTNW